MPFRLSFLLFLILICWGQHRSHAQFSNVSFQHLGPEQGLPIHYITAAVQDTSGFMWVGTMMGMVRYDGKQCRIFDHERLNPHSLSDMLVRSVFMSKNGTLWIGTQNGFNRFDFRTQQFERFYFNQYGKRCNYIRCVAEDTQGKLWLGTASGLLVFDPISKKSELVKLPTDASSKTQVYSIRSIMADGETIWVGTDMGLYRYHRSSKSFQVFCKSDELGSIPDNSLSALAKHPQTGDILVGSRSGMVASLSLSSELFRIIKLPLKEPQEISRIYFDRDQTLWISTLGEGVFYFIKNSDKVGQFLSDINTPSSLGSNYVKSVFQDRAGVIWFSTSYKGLSRFNPYNQSFRSLLKDANVPQPNANASTINRIAVDSKDNLWLATSEGLLWIDAKKTTHKRYLHDPNNPYSLTDNYINSVLVDRNGGVWVGTRSYLHYFDVKTGRFTHFDHLPNEENPSPSEDITRTDFVAGKLIYDLAESGDGRIFIGTEEGLTIYNPKTRIFTNHFNDAQVRKVPVNRFNSLFFDSKNNLWVGCGVDEVLCISPDLSKTVSYRYEESNPKGLPDNGVMAFAEDSKGNIWMGTDNGLGCLNRQTQQFTNFTTRNGLANNYISALIRVGNTLWMGTANGLTRFEENGKRFTSFGSADNLQVLSVETECVAKDSQGNLLFGGLYGLVSFHPNQVKTNSFIPPVAVTSVKVYGKEVLPTLYRQANVPIELDYDQNDLTIEVAALSYDHSENNLFSFWLEGIEKTWGAPTHQTTLNYLNLQPNEYILHVRAANNDGVWNPVPYHLHIIIHPPFWQRWWFRLLLLATLIGSGVYLYRWRVKMIEHEHATEVKLLEEQQTLQNQLNQELTEKLDYQQKFEIAQKQQAETERKTILLEREKFLSKYQNLVNQLNPHFLFNSLAVLDSLIYKDHKLASKYLRQLTKVYRYLIENDDHETVTLEQELRFARDFVSLLHMRYSDGLQIDIHLSETLYHKRIVPVTFQNLIENAIKHNITALESPLKVLIYEDNGYLIFENNLQKRGTVATSNKRGLSDFKALYSYLTNRPLFIEETNTHFVVRVPLLD